MGSSVSAPLKQKVLDQIPLTPSSHDKLLDPHPPADHDPLRPLLAIILCWMNQI